MPSLQRVTVGIDFSAGSRTALWHAARLAPGEAPAIRPVHVVDPLVLADLADALQQPRDSVRAEVERSARQEWARMADECKLAPTDLKIVFEHAVTGLVTEAASSDLLILGSHAEPGDDVGAGIVAAGCARRAPGPVLLVHPGHQAPFRRICVGVDFSDVSREALGWAASVADRRGADLHVVHVFQAPWQRLHYRAPTPEADPEFIRNFTGALERLLASFTDGTPGITDATRLHRHVVNAPKHGAALVDFAKNHSADLIVVGAAGRRGLQHLVMGSTAERVCRDVAATSVLIVRPKEAGA